MRSNIVFGKGVNDADYFVQQNIDGKEVRCPYYQTWMSMIRRCYLKSYSEKNPTYIGCTVCDEWLSFMSFREWMISQDWKGKELDKDILVEGNKEYGPDSCVFVDHDTNTILRAKSATARELPLGVTKISSGFYARCGYGKGSGHSKGLGSFTTPKAAHNAYKKFKSLMILRCALMQTDKRVKSALALRANNMIESSY